MQSGVLTTSAGPAGVSEGRSFIDRALAAAGFDAATRCQITVATNEAVSNAMEVVWAKVYRSHDEALAAAGLS